MIPGGPGDTSRASIERGGVYRDEHKPEGYPQQGDTCPYCLQGLGEAAIAVVRKYRVFCRSDLQEALETARTKLSGLVADLRVAELQSLAQDIEKRADAVREGDALD